MTVVPVGMSPLRPDELMPSASGHALSSNSSRKVTAASVGLLGAGFTLLLNCGRIHRFIVGQMSLPGS